MLQNIRDKSQNWVLGVIVGLLCLAFAFWGVHSYVGDSGDNSDIVAKVNGHTILRSDLNTAYQRLRQQQQMQLGAAFVIDQKTEARLRRQAFNQLVMQQVLSQAAIKDGYRVIPDEVGAALLSIPMFQVDGQFSRDRFSEVLNTILYSETEFLADLQKTMLINQVRSGFSNSSFSLPQDVTNALKLVNQKRDLSYLIIPATQFKGKIQIPDDQALAYYQQHKADFTSPEQVSVEYIKLSLPQLASQLHFTDAQLQQYYQDNISNFTTPQRWHVAHILVKLADNATLQQVADAQAKINGIVQKINAGESFGQLAKQNSEDVVSAKEGGVLEWFGPGMVDPAFEKAVAALKQVGEVSPPVRTKYGLSVIKLIGQEPSQVQPFAKVKDQVQKALAQQEAEKVFADASDKLSNLTYANPGALDVAAKALNLQIKTTDLFNRQGGKDEITANPKVIDAAFSSDVLQGNNSDVVELDPDNLVVVRIKQHIAASLQSFDQVKNQVMELLVAQGEKQAAQQFGQQLLQQIQQGKTDSEIAQQAHQPWQLVSSTGRFDARVPGAILSKAFRAARPEKNSATQEGIVLPNGDYVLLKVLAVKDGDIGKEAAVQQRIYGEELESGFGQLDYSLYVKNLLDKAKVDIKDPKFIQAPASDAS